MIVVTRLNGLPLAVNCDLIERAEATPDTVLTLTDGSKYLIEESLQDLISLIREYQASVLILTNRIQTGDVADANATLHVLRNDDKTEA